MLEQYQEELYIPSNKTINLKKDEEIAFLKVKELKALFLNRNDSFFVENLFDKAVSDFVLDTSKLPINKIIN